MNTYHKHLTIQASQIQDITNNMPLFKSAVCRVVNPRMGCATCEKCRWYNANDLTYTLHLEDGSTRQVTDRFYFQFNPEISDYFVIENGAEKILCALVMREWTIEQKQE